MTHVHVKVVKSIKSVTAVRQLVTKSRFFTRYSEILRRKYNER